MLVNQTFTNPDELCKFVNTTLGVEIVSIVPNDTGYILFYKFYNQ